MVGSSSTRVRIATALAFCLSAAIARDAAAQPEEKRSVRLSSAAERVYKSARPRLLQIRTMLGAAGRQSSSGSGFLVSADGLAITNYHVVSQYALEPTSYRLEYTAADGSRGALTLLAFDIANDLAAVRLDRPAQGFFDFDARALREMPAKGERLYSMGNPLNLGFTIVEGTYNGPVERTYNERIHFSGAINPGMSGGPTVSAASRIVGVNVAKRRDGELVSFLVPARFAAALVARAEAAAPLTTEAIRAEIARQLTEWQGGLYKAINGEAWRAAAFGPYRAPESPAAWFNCWSDTNANQVPAPRAMRNSTYCHTNTWVFVAGDLGTGQVRTGYSYLKSVDLNDFQFAAFVSQHYQAFAQGWSEKHHTRTRCHESFLDAGTEEKRPPMRAVWCARAYRELQGLYDVSVMAVTQDSAREALVARLSMQGVAYENAMQLAQRFLDEVRVER